MTAPLESPPTEHEPVKMGPHSPISSAMQDYLKVMYAAGEWSAEPLSTSWLATKLGVAPSSVSSMVGKLKNLDLVDHRPYGSIELTLQGQLMGKAMVRRHRLIETFLVAELGYSWDEVHAEAEILEHAISDLMLDRIDVKLGHPTRDPHGDPIPGHDGSVVIPAAHQLSTLRQGESGVVARLSDTDSELLRFLETAGVHLDVRITVGEVNRFGGGTLVELDDGNGGTTAQSLGELAMDSIWVVPN